MKKEYVGQRTKNMTRDSDLKKSKKAALDSDDKLFFTGSKDPK